MRIRTEIWIGGLRRRIEAAGGFVTVIAKGDPEAGTVVLLLRGGDGLTTALSRVNMGDGKVSWQPIYEDREDSDEKAHLMLEKRRKFDPDLWIVELDVAQPRRFIDPDELNY